MGHCLQVSGMQVVRFCCRDDPSARIHNNGGRSRRHTVPREDAAGGVYTNPARNLLSGEKCLHHLRIFVVDGDELNLAGSSPLAS